jgi:NAD-dependent dihydropyrimidine dehydrogenase PreA subunit
MGIFIEVRVDREACRVAEGCQQCVKVCPVSAFEVRDGQVRLIYDNEDECTLCSLCVDQCPAHAVSVVRRY